MENRGLKESTSSFFVEKEIYRNVIGHFSSGVSIVTVNDDGVNYGITASAVCSVSLEPPMLLVCVNQNTGTCHAISKAKSFTVNILGIEQAELALQFARPNSDKFADVKFSYGELGNPLLDHTLAQIECRLVNEITGGTHSIFLGEVQSAQADSRNPLVYFRGKFGEFKQI